jgi:hypothetical protein
MKLLAILALASALPTSSRIAVPVVQKVLILDEELQCPHDSKPDCQTECLIPQSTGMQLISCTDSSNVNKYTCTYESARHDADCGYCGGNYTESNTKINKKLCQTTCEYSFVGVEDICASLCPQRNEYNNIALSHCTQTDDFLICKYDGINQGHCASCPTDDEIGNDWYFMEKTSMTQHKFCSLTCRYDK